MREQDPVKQVPNEDKALDLLKFNYGNLHESFWNCHKIAWTVTEIFIPVLFAMLTYIVKEGNQSLTVVQAMMAFGVTETLLIIWLLTMRILGHYNEVRRDKLKEIESIFVKVSPSFGHYTIKEYKDRPREGKLSPTKIYWIIFIFYTLMNLIVLLAVAFEMM